MGDPATVRATVDEFYKRLLADPDLQIFFKDVNLIKLKMHQVEFMKIAFTAISRELDVPALIIQKHERLFREKGLNAIRFDPVAGHFVATLDQLGVSKDPPMEAANAIFPLRLAFVEGAENAAKRFE